MEKVMIPAEAVEVAARSIFALDQERHMNRIESDAAWERLDSETERDDYRYAARAALESAAPYMRAIQVDGDAILSLLEIAGIDKAERFDAMVAVQKLTDRTTK